MDTLEALRNNPPKTPSPTWKPEPWEVLFFSQDHSPSSQNQEWEEVIHKKKQKQKSKSNSRISSNSNSTVLPADIWQHCNSNRSQTSMGSADKASTTKKASFLEESKSRHFQVGDYFQEFPLPSVSGVDQSNLDKSSALSSASEITTHPNKRLDNTFNILDLFANKVMVPEYSQILVSKSKDCFLMVSKSKDCLQSLHFFANKSENTEIITEIIHKLNPDTIDCQQSLKFVANNNKNIKITQIFDNCHPMTKMHTKRYEDHSLKPSHNFSLSHTTTLDSQTKMSKDMAERKGGPESGPPPAAPPPVPAPANHRQGPRSFDLAKQIWGPESGPPPAATPPVPAPVPAPKGSYELADRKGAPESGQPPATATPRPGPSKVSPGWKGAPVSGSPPASLATHGHIHGPIDLAERKRAPESGPPTAKPHPGSRNTWAERKGKRAPGSGPPPALPPLVPATAQVPAMDIKRFKVKKEREWTLSEKAIRDNNTAIYSLSKAINGPTKVPWQRFPLTSTGVPCSSPSITNQSFEEVDNALKARRFLAEDSILNEMSSIHSTTCDFVKRLSDPVVPKFNSEELMSGDYLEPRTLNKYDCNDYEEAWDTNGNWFEHVSKSKILQWVDKKRETCMLLERARFVAHSENEEILFHLHKGVVIPLALTYAIRPQNGDGMEPEVPSPADSWSHPDSWLQVTIDEKCSVLVQPGNKIPMQLAKQTYLVKTPLLEEQKHLLNADFNPFGNICSHETPKYQDVDIIHAGKPSESELTMAKNSHLKMDRGCHPFSISASIDESVKDRKRNWLESDSKNDNSVTNKYIRGYLGEKVTREPAQCMMEVSVQMTLERAEKEKAFRKSLPVAKVRLEKLKKNQLEKLKKEQPKPKYKLLPRKESKPHNNIESSDPEPEEEEDEVLGGASESEVDNRSKDNTWNPKGGQKQYTKRRRSTASQNSQNSSKSSSSSKRSTKKDGSSSKTSSSKTTTNNKKSTGTDRPRVTTQKDDPPPPQLTTQAQQYQDQSAVQLPPDLPHLALELLAQAQAQQPPMDTVHIPQWLQKIIKESQQPPTQAHHSPAQPGSSQQGPQGYAPPQWAQLFERVMQMEHTLLTVLAKENTITHYTKYVGQVLLPPLMARKNEECSALNDALNILNGNLLDIKRALESRPEVDKTTMDLIASNLEAIKKFVEPKPMDDQSAINQDMLDINLTRADDFSEDAEQQNGLSPEEIYDIFNCNNQKRIFLANLQAALQGKDSDMVHIPQWLQEIIKEILNYPTAPYHDIKKETYNKAKFHPTPTVLPEEGVRPERTTDMENLQTTNSIPMKNDQLPQAPPFKESPAVKRRRTPSPKGNKQEMVQYRPDKRQRVPHPKQTPFVDTMRGKDTHKREPKRDHQMTPLSHKEQRKNEGGANRLSRSRSRSRSPSIPRRGGANRLSRSRSPSVPRSTSSGKEEDLRERINKGEFRNNTQFRNTRYVPGDSKYRHRKDPKRREFRGREDKDRLLLAMENGVEVWHKIKHFPSLQKRKSLRTLLLKTLTHEDPENRNSDRQHRIRIEKQIWELSDLEKFPDIRDELLTALGYDTNRRSDLNRK